MAQMTDAQLQALYAAGTKYRREMLAMPLAKLEPILAHMALREGVVGKEVVFQADDQAELRPYRTEKGAVSGLPSIEPRELETYLGDVVREFDPHLLLGSILGGSTSDDITTSEITRLACMLMVSRVSEKLAKAIFTATRKPSGSTTNDLFDGFCTIINTEIAASKIAEAKGNLANLGEVNHTNAVDLLMQAYLDAAHDELQDVPTKFFIPRNIYNAYNKDYQSQFGSVAYNREYKKVFLEGTDDLCELVPMSGLRGTEMGILTVKENMLVGVDRLSDKETAEVRRPDNPKLVQLFLKMFFGVQLETISPEKLLVVKFTASTPSV